MARSRLTTTTCQGFGAVWGPALLNGTSAPGAPYRHGRVRGCSGSHRSRFGSSCAVRKAPRVSRGVRRPHLCDGSCSGGPSPPARPCLGHSQRRTALTESVLWSPLFLLCTATEHEDIEPLPTLGGDVRVNGDDLSSRMISYYCFKVSASSLEDLLAHGFDEPASLVAVGELLLGRREHSEATNDHQILDHPGSYPFGTASDELVLEGHHLVADGRLGLALPTRRCCGVHLFCAPPPGGAPTTKAGGAPHLLTHRGDAVTGPVSAGHPGEITEEAAEM